MFGFLQRSAARLHSTRDKLLWIFVATIFSSIVSSLIIPAAPAILAVLTVPLVCPLSPEDCNPGRLGHPDNLGSPNFIPLEPRIAIRAVRAVAAVLAIPQVIRPPIFLR
jgi:hypothetical protein